MRPRRGFTLAELMIVVCVIGVVLALAVPAYATSRERTRSNACAKNRELFDQAKQLWMIDNGKTTADEVYFKDLLPEYIAEPPVCPTKGHYDLHGLTGETSCTQHGR